MPLGTLVLLAGSSVRAMGGLSQATRDTALKGFGKRGLSRDHASAVEAALFAATAHLENDAAIEPDAKSPYIVKFRALCCSLRENPGRVNDVAAGRLTAEALVSLPATSLHTKERQDRDAAMKRSALKSAKRLPGKIFHAKGIKRRRGEDQGEGDFREAARMQK